MLANLHYYQAQKEPPSKGRNGQTMFPTYTAADDNMWAEEAAEHSCRFVSPPYFSVLTKYINIKPLTNLIEHPFKL